jgi:hypothetical protein
VPEAANTPQLEALLQHPSLWRGRGIAAGESFATGFTALDQALPGGGWPRRGLVEILVPGIGFGELRLWAPLVTRLTRSEVPRWCAFIAPPFEPYVPAWNAQGVRLDRLLVVRTVQPLWALEQSHLSEGGARDSLWALEQSLLSGACSITFAWPQRTTMPQLRRLSLATERGASLGVLFRPLRSAVEHTTAVLRIALTRTATQLRIELLKGRGVMPQIIELPVP